MITTLLSKFHVPAALRCCQDDVKPFPFVVAVVTCHSAGTRAWQHPFGTDRGCPACWSIPAVPPWDRIYLRDEVSISGLNASKGGCLRPLGTPRTSARENAQLESN